MSSCSFVISSDFRTQFLWMWSSLFEGGGGKQFLRSYASSEWTNIQTDVFQIIFRDLAKKLALFWKVNQLYGKYLCKKILFLGQICLNILPNFGVIQTFFLLGDQRKTFITHLSLFIIVFKKKVCLSFCKVVSMKKSGQCE